PAIRSVDCPKYPPAFVRNKLPAEPIMDEICLLIICIIYYGNKLGVDPPAGRNQKNPRPAGRTPTEARPSKPCAATGQRATRTCRHHVVDRLLRHLQGHLLQRGGWQAAGSRPEHWPPPLLPEIGRHRIDDRTQKEASRVQETKHGPEKESG